MNERKNEERKNNEKRKRPSTLTGHRQNHGPKKTHETIIFIVGLATQHVLSVREMRK